MSLEVSDNVPERSRITLRDCVKKEHSPVMDIIHHHLIGIVSSLLVVDIPIVISKTPENIAVTEIRRNLQSSLAEFTLWWAQILHLLSCFLFICFTQFLNFIFQLLIIAYIR